MKTKMQTSATAAEQEYTAPQTETIEIEVLQNILGGSNIPLPGIPGEDWG